MRKALLSFTIAMVATALVACGNKTAQNAESTDSATVEEQTEQKAEEPQKEEAKSPEFKAETFECDYFTAELPAGHKAGVAGQYGWQGNVFELKDDGTQKNSGTRVELTHPSKQTIAEFIKMQSNGAKPIEKYGSGTYEIGGEKFQTWFKSGMVYFLREDTKNGGHYNFAIPEFAFEKQQIVMDVLNSVKFK